MRRGRMWQRWLGTAVAGLMIGGGLIAAPAHASSPSYDVSVASDQWALSAFNAYKIRTSGYHAQGVVVAVVDTGVDKSMPDLSGSVLAGADCSSGTCLTPDNGDADSKEMHGTSMASLIAAHGHDVQASGSGLGMEGLATRAKILPVDVGATQTDFDIAQGVRWAVQHGVKVINLSLSDPSDQDSLRSAIEYAISSNVVVVAAAGNDGRSGNPVEYPAAYPGVVAVSGVDSKYAFWPDSESGAQIALAGPAVHVATAGVSPTGYVFADGTSDATAYVSGEAALLIGEHPDWTSGQIIRQMIDTADPQKGLARGQHSDELGYGVMDPLNALTSTVVPADTSNPLCGSSGCSSSAATTPAGPSDGTSAGGATATGGPKAAASSSSNTGLIAGVAGGAAVLAGVIIALVLAMRRRNRPGPPGGPREPPSGYGPPGYGGPSEQPPRGPWQ